MLIKVATATNLQLNWLVAKCKGEELVYFNTWFRQNGFDKGFPEAQIDQHLHWQTNFKERWVRLEKFVHQPQHREPETLKRARNVASYTTDWAQGGPIVESMFAQGLRIHTNEFMPRKDGPLLIVASLNGDVHTGFYFGPTPLIAAMRCYVASRLGEECEVPDELA